VVNSYDIAGAMVVIYGEEQQLDSDGSRRYDRRFALTDASGDWKRATNWLNSLAMFEMLPALQNLSQETRTNLAAPADKILKALGWTGSAERIRWAAELVDQDTLPNWAPAGLPQDRLDDAQRFLNDRDGILGPWSTKGEFSLSTRKGEGCSSRRSTTTG
jgi:hypothetical protein